MTRQELTDKCLTRVAELSVKLSSPPMESEFYNDFCRNYNLKSINGLLKIPYVDFTIALLYCEIDDKPLYELTEDVSSFSNIFLDLDSDELKIFNSMIMAYIRTGNINDLEKIFKDTNTRRMKLKFKEIFNDNKVSLTAEEKSSLSEIHAAIGKVIDSTGMSNCNVLKLIDYYKICPDTMNSIINIIRAFKFIKEGKETLDFNSKEFRDKYKIKTLLEIFSAINECRRRINEDDKKYESSIRHELNIYKKFLKDMENAFSKEEIKNYEAIIHDIDDEEIKEEFLKLVYQHNKLVYEEVDIIHEELTKNSIVNYLSILKNNGIKKDEVDLNKVMKNSCDDLDKMLKILNNIVEDKNMVIRIIEISNYPIICYFSELKSKGVLSKKVFTNYPDIFAVDSEIRKLLDKNIQIVNRYEVDFTIFSKKPDVLVENNNLANNLEVLKQYNLLSNLKDLRKYSFLKKDNLNKTIDKIIELGYEELLLSNLDLLNEDNWDRIYVLKSMGLQPTDIDDLISVLRDDKFFVCDSKLNLYIEDVGKYYDNLNIDSTVNVVEFIKERGNGLLSLSIDGVIISKNRILEGINSEDISVSELFRKIIDGGIFSMEEVNIIKNGLRSKEKIDK